MRGKVAYDDEVDGPLPDTSNSHRSDYHHGLGHSALLPFDPYRVAWKHHSVVYLDYSELQSLNLEIKWVVDTRTHKVKNPIHTVSHNRVHKSSHEMSHETLRK